MRQLRVLVTEPIDEAGLSILSERCDVVVRIGLKGSQLQTAIPEYEGLLVRSETPVTASIISAGDRLEVIGRAGVGVDNIDVDAATLRGIVVVNAPTANTVAAAEHTLALMLALARHLPAAHAALREGKWERRAFLGVELRHKTLGIIGLGRVGREVAARAQALAMRVIAYDPYLPAEVGERMSVPLVGLEDLLGQADFVTVHLPLNETTKGLIGRAQFAQMKPGARVINAGRGAVVDEDALLAALDSGSLDGAALDVFAQEPPDNPRLLRHPKVVVTPHLGGSTQEAAVEAAVDVARQLLAVFEGRLSEHAVNGPYLPPESRAVLGPYVDLAERLGGLLGQLVEGPLGELRVAGTGEIATHDLQPLTAAVLRGLLEPISEERVNLVNAHVVARRWNLRVVEERRAEAGDAHPLLLTVELSGAAGRRLAVGGLVHGEPHLLRLESHAIDVLLRGYLLICQNDDRPGMIGKVGTLLGNADVNIAYMKVGRDQPRGRAVMVLGLDDPLPAELLRDLVAIPGLSDARQVRL